MVSDSISDAPEDYDIARITAELMGSEFLFTYELVGRFRAHGIYMLDFDVNLDGMRDKTVPFVNSPDCNLIGANEFHKDLLCQVSLDMHVSRIEGISVDDLGVYTFGIQALDLDASTGQLVDIAPDQGYASVEFASGITETEVVGKYVVISFLQAPSPRVIDTTRRLLPLVDDGLAEIARLFGEQPTQIQLTFAKKLEHGGQAIPFTNNILVRYYPGDISDPELLSVIFHEASHIFTFQTGFVLGSVSEGIAYVGALQPLQHQYPDYPAQQEAEFLDELQRYENAGSPFWDVDWKSEHPRDGWKSDYIMAGIFLVVTQRYGIGVFASDELDRLVVAGEATSANLLVSSLALASRDPNIVDLFRDWNFPLDEDSDGDGTTDGEEIRCGTDMLSQDTDSDGLSDSEETRVGTDPRACDTDADGWRDGIDPSPMDSLLPNYVILVLAILAVVVALALVHRRRGSPTSAPLRREEVSSFPEVSSSQKVHEELGLSDDSA